MVMLDGWPKRFELWDLRCGSMRSCAMGCDVMRFEEVHQSKAESRCKSEVLFLSHTVSPLARLGGAETQRDTADSI